MVKPSSSVVNVNEGGMHSSCPPPASDRTYRARRQAIKLASTTALCSQQLLLCGHIYPQSPRCANDVPRCGPTTTPSSSPS